MPQAGVNFSIEAGVEGEVPVYVAPVAEEFHPEAGDNFSVQGNEVTPLD